MISPGSRLIQEAFHSASPIKQKDAYHLRIGVAAHLKVYKAYHQRVRCCFRKERSMRKMLLFSLFVLCSPWICAQTGSGQDVVSTTQTGSGGSRTTVSGCLNRSSDHYTLTDNSGTTYQLAGDTANLNEHVGHTIAVTGIKNSPAPNASGNPGTTANPGNPGIINTFDVSSVKLLASGCGSSR
jgi:hypothetical protein